MKLKRNNIFSIPRHKLTMILCIGIALTLLNSIVFSAKKSTKKPGPHQWDKKLGPIVSHKNFPSDCSLCHEATKWNVIKDKFEFNHEKETGFKLEGSHASAFCIRCHNDRGAVERYAAKGCSGCHIDIHRGSHGLSCEKCHGQDNWRVTKLATQHSATRFPLTGAHVSVTCEKCHPGAAVGIYRPASSLCYTCHNADYARAPNHVTSGFSTACDSCHNTRTWSDANFSHAFPQSHHNAPNCATCHPGGNTNTVTCFGCHPHSDQTITNNKHTGENGYSYNSNACVSCHPTGHADGD